MLKYAKHDIVLQEEGANEDLLTWIDNSKALGAIPLELLSSNKEEKVSGYMNFTAAKTLGYNLSNKELLDELGLLIFHTRSESMCDSHDEYEFKDLRILVFHPTEPEEIPEEMRETTSVSEILPNCTWHKFGDGSGYLDGPRKGQELVNYDLLTKEYQIDKKWYELVGCNTTTRAIQQMEVILCKIMDTFTRLYINWYGSCNENALEKAAENGENANDLAIKNFLETAKEEELTGYILYSTGGRQDVAYNFLKNNLPSISEYKKENIRKILDKIFYE